MKSNICKIYKIQKRVGYMTAIMSLGLGYLMGCINPAMLISRRKHVNLREEGTGNLGATNTAYVLGRHAGYFVLIFDVAKSFFFIRSPNGCFQNF